MKIPLFWPAIYKDEWLKELDGVFSTRWIGQGPLVDEFEKQFGQKFDFEHCISVNSGTSALELAYHLIGIKKGDEVLTPVFTCLQGNETVLLPNNKYEKISKLVSEKYDGDVVSMNEKTGELENKKVIGWYKHPVGSNSWFNISTENAQNTNSKGKKRGVWVTNDHKFLTSNRGYIRADRLEKNDYLITSQPDFNEMQKFLFVGVMLGDGSVRTGRSFESSCCRFDLDHSEVQEEWLNKKIFALEGFQYKKSEFPAYRQSKKRFGAVFSSTARWSIEKKRWYKGNRKVLPKNLNWKDFNGLTLATWYMDDGSLHKNGAAVICSESFSLNENKKLVSILEKLGIKSVIQVSNKNNKQVNRIYIGNGNNGGKKITNSNTDVFFRKIAPWVIPSMRYKLPLHISKEFPYESKRWNLGKAIPFADKVVVSTGIPKLSKSHLSSVYCIDVEDNHNFVSKGMILHNCTATNIPLARRGARLNFLDINDRLLVDYEDIKKKISKKTKALVVVTLGGIRIEDRVFELAKEFGVPVVIDAAQSVGIREPKGDYVCYSFQAIKHFTTGDGGMLIVRDQEQYQRAKKLRWFGIDREAKKRANWKWTVNHQMAMDIEEHGFKHHMNDISAAMGLVGLRHSDEILTKRQKLCKLYEKYLTSSQLIYGDACWLLAILTNNRNKLMDKLEKNGIESDLVQIRNDAFKVFGIKAQLPNMAKLEDKYLYLPLHPKLSPKDVEYIASIIKQ